MRNDRSFIELRARERAHALLDDGSAPRASSRSPTTVWWSPKARSTASLRW